MRLELETKTLFFNIAAQIAGEWKSQKRPFLILQRVQSQQWSSPQKRFTFKWLFLHLKLLPLVILILILPRRNEPTCGYINVSCLSPLFLDLFLPGHFNCHLIFILYNAHLFPNFAQKESHTCDDVSSFFLLRMLERFSSDGIHMLLKQNENWGRRAAEEEEDG